MEIQNVDALPTLDQASFPVLPDVPKGKNLIVFNTPWKNAEKEFAAACIVNACIVAGEWQPVHVQQFVDRMEANPLIAPFIIQGVANALWTLVSDGYVEEVRYMEENHFIPTKKLADAVLGDPRYLRTA